MNIENMWREGLIIPPPTKRKIFISYHHEGDQNYYENFSSLFSDTYDIVFDNSLERSIDSDDPQYVRGSKVLDPQQIQANFPKYKALKTDMLQVNESLIRYRKKMQELVLKN